MKGTSQHAYSNLAPARQEPAGGPKRTAFNNCAPHNGPFRPLPFPRPYRRESGRYAGRPGMRKPRSRFRILGADRVCEVEGQEARTLAALQRAGAAGITALEVSTWALRLAHYVM